MRWRVEPARVAGSLEVPGDKSIAHRALMFGGLADGRSVIEHLPGGEDVRATARCMRELGVEIDMDGEIALISSTGSLSTPGVPLDTANSGTSMRLLAGILAGQPFDSCLAGDASLSRRPMGRVIEPLSQMGAAIRSRAGHAPLEIHGASLHGITYTLPVASAQVKSAILLAGLFASGETRVVEPIPTRDHTERMLQGLGVEVRRSGTEITVSRGRPGPLRLRVPGDPSSAAFFFAAAALTGGEIEVTDMCVNPTRTGILAALRRMGVGVEIRNERLDAGEPVASVHVDGEIQSPLTIDAAEVPTLVDEIPLVVLLATQAPGRSVIRGAEELRVKETDRIATVTEVLNAMGARVSATPDGFVIEGPTPLRGGTVASHGDHRLAMMQAIAGSCASGTTIIEDAEAVDVSFPGFDEALAGVGGRIGRG